jgi:hypothetical protein
MKRAIFLFIFLGTLTVCHAQWRLQLQAGPSFSLRPILNDSLLSTTKNAFHLQGSMVYYWGHMGLGLTLGYLKQDKRTDANKNPPPSFLNGVDTFTVEGGAVKAVYLLAGPEFCFACGHKWKFNLGIRAGISLIKNEPYLLTRQNTLWYRTDLQRKAPFTFNMGFGAHYFFNPHWAVGAIADYHHISLKVNNRDIRRGINNVVLLKQKKDLLNLGLALTYKFQ